VVELQLKLNDKQNVVYFPPLLVSSMRTRHFKIIPNDLAAILCPHDAKLEDVLASLRVLIQDLELKVQRQTRAANREQKR